MSYEPPPTAWPPPTPGRLAANLLCMVVPLGLAFLAIASVEPPGPRAPAAPLVTMLLAIPWSIVVAQELPRGEQRRVARRIAAGSTPWEAAAPWRTRCVRTARADGLALGRVMSFVPIWCLLQAAFGQGDGYLVAAAMAALPVTVGLLRSALRGGFVVHTMDAPVRTGSVARFSVSMDASASAVSGLRCVLRCVRTCPEPWRSARTPRLLFVTGPTGAWPDAAGPEQEILVEFHIPHDAPGTDLGDPAPIHWEVALTGRTAWGDVWGVAQVPVYDAGASGAA